MSSYYSPFAILTDSQKAPCVFELAVPLLGPLNNGNPVEQGTRVDLPLWLASILTSSEPAGPGNGYICLIELPASMGKKVINALRADPKSVELRQQAAFWFGMSEHMMILLEDEAVQEVIIDSFKQRALEIADKAQNSRSVQQGSGGDEFMNGLDQTERELFRAAHDGSKAVKNWFDVASHRT